MAQIQVLRPDVDTVARAAAALAPRRMFDEDANVTLIENGKPKAKELLQLISEELRKRARIGRVDVFSKPSAAKAIVEDEAKMMAARSHMVITGLGD